MNDGMLHVWLSSLACCLAEQTDGYVGGWVGGWVCLRAGSWEEGQVVDVYMGGWKSCAYCHAEAICNNTIVCRR